ANKVNIKLGMYSDWIKLEKTSSNYSKYIATGPKNAKDQSRSRFDFTISGVPTLPQKGNLPFVNVETIPVYAYVSYVATINGTETTKYYILKYEYSDYIIDAKTLEDTRDKELNVSSTYIQWRYKNDTSWTNSVAIESLTGVEARVEDNYIQWKRKCDTEWTNLRDITSLSRYEEGKTVEVGVSNNYIRWKYTDETSWNTLYSTSNTGLSGIDAIKVDDGYIQWKRQNTDWKNLIAVTELPGYTTDAIVDVRLSGGNIQFNFTVKSEEDEKPKTGDWITLQTIESVVGVQVRFDNNNNVQWKCADETEWRNLLDNGKQVTKDNLGTAVKYGPTAGGIE
nr:hypothetical protein [Anaeroplasmataceae bacterium]